MDNIDVWLRVRNAARFARDMRQAAGDVRKLGRAADEANGPWSKLGGALSNFADNIPQLTGRTRIFGFAVGTVVSAIVLLIPLVVGLSGAVVALTGSLAAATIGATLLAGAFSGVMIAGLGAVGLVLFDAIKNFTAVNTRFQTYKQAVSAFGADSKQAATALKRLNGVVQQSGGPMILEAVAAFRDLRNEFEKQLTPVTQQLLGFLLMLFDAAKKLIPVFVRFTGIVVTALGGVLKSWLNFLTSPFFQNALISIANTFASLAGPIGDGLLSIFGGLVTLIVRLLPVLQPIADGFANIGAQFAAWAQTADLSPFLNQFRSWWNLLKAAGGLLVTILSSGASSGQNLVDSLTAVLNSWNAILQTPKGQQDLKSFFSDAVEMTKQFSGVVASVVKFIFQFARAAIPLYTRVLSSVRQVFGQIMDALRPAKPFWDNVLWPLIKGLAAGIIAQLVGAFKFAIFFLKLFATILGFVGGKLGWFKPIIQEVGFIIGFLFGPGILLKVAEWLGRVSILLKPLAAGFKLLALPMRLAGALLGRLFGWAVKVGGWFLKLGIRIIPGLGRAFSAVVSFITGLFPRFLNLGIQLAKNLGSGFRSALAGVFGLAGGLAKKVGNALIGLLNHALPNKIPIPGPIPDINLPDNPIPMLSQGGIVSGTGSWITGEAGPELNTLRGGRVTVQPLPAVSVPAPSSASLDTGGPKRVIVSKVYLRGKQIAEAVADEAEDDIARRGGFVGG